MTKALQYDSQTHAFVSRRWLHFFVVCVVVNWGHLPSASAMFDEGTDEFWTDSSRGMVALSSSVARQNVPAFSISDRDRYRAAALGEWGVSQSVRLGLRWDWLHDVYPSGETRSGPGDVRLRTSVDVMSGTYGVLRTGWQVKLPNAADEGELGTDETDVWMWAQGEREIGDWLFWTTAGVGILGDPLRYTAQDDVPFAAGGVGYAPAHTGAWVPTLRVGAIGTMQTSRNPSRARTDFVLEWGDCAFTRAEMGVGWTAASPRQVFALRIGQRWGCRSGSGD